LCRVLGFCGGFSSETSGVFSSGLPAGVFGREMLGCLGGLGQHLVKACCTVMWARLGAGERIRTAGLPFTRRLLCLLSYTGQAA
jgi:hypothetical protein